MQKPWLLVFQQIGCYPVRHSNNGETLEKGDLNNMTSPVEGTDKELQLAPSPYLGTGKNLGLKERKNWE